MLTLALLLAGLAPAPLTLDVRIYLGAELSEEIVVSALRETERISNLMRSAFSHRSLTARGRRAFRFAEEDLQAIRDTLLQVVAKNKGASLRLLDGGVAPGINDGSGAPPR